MESFEFELDQAPKCPHCREEMEGEAQDYVVLGAVGKPLIGSESKAEDECWICGAPFVAERINEETVRFEEA